MIEQSDKLFSMINESNYTVVLTGAGMSTESGVPDFRSAGGWWRKMDPAKMASIDSLYNNYDMFKEFYKYRLKILRECSPNSGHKALAYLEERGFIKYIATQNVDGFHIDAGSKNVLELHGSINDIYCISCKKRADVKDFVDDKQCVKCGGKLRPGVVLFGEGLPRDIWEKAYMEVEKSDLLIVIGTSLNVSPVNSLPLVSKGRKVLINSESTMYDDIFDLVIRAKVGDVQWERFE